MTFDRARMARDLREGLSEQPRRIPPKYFYDERGSRLFDEITRLPEYYPTRAERELLIRWSRTIIGIARPRTLVELGAGSADKTRTILDEMLRAAQDDVTYIPVDVSAGFLAQSAAQLRDEYPSLCITPVAADFSTHFALPDHPSPALHAFLGSTIGNFTPDEAVSLVSSVRERMESGDYFLLGVDLRKDSALIESAYNDSRGVTARFNRNMLSVINDCLGANFNVSAFDHSAIYNEREHRIEMRLIARAEQSVAIPDVGDFTFADGDWILTEVSYKYDRALAADVLAQSELVLREWFTDDAGLFALALSSR
ncbi:MAG: L-histidine N(alpha)-methyltransferase [Gemmatimonadaceae bacterium]